MRGNFSEPHFDVSLFSNSGEKVWKARKTMGEIWPTVFLHFMIFSLRLETNDTLQCSSDSLPHMVINILFVENCQNYILTHRCLPIAGSLFYNVRKLHGPRIRESNILFNLRFLIKAHWYQWLLNLRVVEGFCRKSKHFYSKVIESIQNAGQLLPVVLRILCLLWCLWWKRRHTLALALCQDSSESSLSLGQVII